MATQAEDVGALKYRAAELSSRLEMMQAQLSKVNLRQLCTRGHDASSVMTMGHYFCD